MPKPKVNPAGDHTYASALDGSTDRVRRLSDAARTLIADVMPGVTEVAWPKQSVIGYGLGPKKMSEHFCYIGVYAEHINLGFLYGADLHDPSGLLSGSGKMLRHIKIQTLDDLERQGVRELVEHASRHLPKLKNREAR